MLTELFANIKVKQIITSVFTLILTFYAAFVLCINLLLPLAPDCFNKIALILHTPELMFIAYLLFLPAITVYFVLTIWIKISNYKIFSQKNPELKFKGIQAAASFCLPAMGIAFALFVAYRLSFLSNFDFSDVSADYASTLISEMRYLRYAIIHFLAFIVLSSFFAKGLPEAFFHLGLSHTKYYPTLKVFIAAMIFASLACSAIAPFYFFNLDSILQTVEEPMVIVR